MCWSFEASITTWIIGLCTSLYLLKRRNKNDIVMGLLILAYSSMQLWEALMWYDQKCGNINIIGTKLAYIALWTHVLAIAIGLYFEYNKVIPIFIGIFFLICAGILWPKKWNCSLKGENKHLVWGFDPTFYIYVFIMCIFLCLYYIKPFKISMLISLLFITSFLISYMYNNKYETTGSFWCWICAVFCLIFIKINQ